MQDLHVVMPELRIPVPASGITTPQSFKMYLRLTKAHFSECSLQLRNLIHHNINHSYNEIPINPLIALTPCNCCLNMVTHARLWNWKTCFQIASYILPVAPQNETKPFIPPALEVRSGPLRQGSVKFCGLHLNEQQPSAF